jgi:predicted CXXCH cytochrome family protein
MMRRWAVLGAVVSLALGPWAVAGAATKAGAKKEKAQAKPRSEVAPLPASEKPPFAHAPFEAGDCATCHQKDDPKAPGPVKSGINEICFGCHEELQEAVTKRQYKHPPAQDACTNCHNPHNSRQPKLLTAERTQLCFSCHSDIEQLATTSKVKHGALTTGSTCANCHNPHGSAVEKLLVELPFDLCVKCHSADDMTDGRGKTLTNFKKWLDENKVWHAPVEAKDCSACHKTHGGENFRLLVAPYPAAFYAPYDAKAYELCFTCHNADAITEPETTTLTSFRDGARNLHFVHVKQEHGRTCRACHEVHASKQEHHIRESVPYGRTGWILKLNYTKTATGGQCAKTCHGVKSYNNGSKAAQATK